MSRDPHGSLENFKPARRSEVDVERFRIEFQWIDLPVAVSHPNSRGTGSVSLRVRLKGFLLTYLLTYLFLPSPFYRLAVPLQLYVVSSFGISMDSNNFG